MQRRQIALNIFYELGEHCTFTEEQALKKFKEKTGHSRISFSETIGSFLQELVELRSFQYINYVYRVRPRIG